MSADNCIYVFSFEHAGRTSYGVSMEFLSAPEENWGKRPTITAPTFETALIEAHRWHDREPIVEYGVIVQLGLATASTSERP